MNRIRQSVRTVSFSGLKLKDACGLLGGEFEDLGNLKVCEIKKGLESYFLIEKENSHIEFLSKNPREIRVITELNGVTDITCEVSLDNTNNPLETSCIFYKKGADVNSANIKDEGEAVVVDINVPRSITVHKYDAQRTKDGDYLLLTFSEKVSERLGITPNFREFFKEIYSQRVKSTLSLLGGEVK